MRLFHNVDIVHKAQLLDLCPGNLNITHLLGPEDRHNSYHVCLTIYPCG